jgi:arsenical-resistance protein 2
VVCPLFLPSHPCHIISLRLFLGSSQGRGPRCAGWFQDYIDDIAKFGRRTAPGGEIKVLVLKGGVKGWVRDFEGSLMEGFVEEYWEQFK